MKDKQKYDQMVKLLGRAKDKQNMEEISLLFIFDMSFDRGDITEAMRDVEIQKGWR
jgi:hypothetical protein